MNLKNKLVELTPEIWGLGETLNNWRVNRIDCDYNPFISNASLSKELCNKAIADCD